MSADLDVVPYHDHYEHLADELRRLDLLIWLRAMTLRLHNQAFPEAQTQRAVYITPEEVAWLLAQDVTPRPEDATVAEVRADLARLGTAIHDRVERSRQAGLFLALPQLGHLFGLSALELETIVICLAPELRRKYDRLYAYLQDDITRKRPSVDLVLELLCETEAERWQARRFFSATAPLLRAGLLEKVTTRTARPGQVGWPSFSGWTRVSASFCWAAIRWTPGWPTRRGSTGRTVQRLNCRWTRLLPPAS
jgi:hypothetical protein